MSEEPTYPDPSDIGSRGGPPVEEKPYKILFEANACIGAGHCATASDNWSLNVDTGIAVPDSYFIGKDELAATLDAADRCPAKKGRGVIHVIDRRSGEELAPDPHGDGTISVDW